MLARRSLFVLSLALVGIACATGQEIEEGAQALETPDTGAPVSSLKASANDAAAAVTPADAGTTKKDTDAGAPVTDADVPDIVFGPTTPACGSNPIYSIYVFQQVLSGSPPPACVGGNCATGMGLCCYQGQYCILE